MPRARENRGPLRSLFRLLWLTPLLAAPFALFFGTLYGGNRQTYLGAYLASLLFAFVIGLCNWALEHFVLAVLLRPNAAGREPPPWVRSAAHGTASLLGTFLAALIAQFTFMPGMMGSARAVLLLAMFALIFSGLFLGILSAVSFHRQAIDRARADEELSLARRIQRSFLLTRFPQRPRFEVHAVNLSSKEVSGDFYDVVAAGDRAFLLAIADVAGKGVPAALLSSMLQASLRTQANGQPSVAAILRNINSLAYRSTTVHQFATFFLARIDEDSLRLDFSNAGHNHPVLFRRDGRRETLERGGVVVGVLEGATYEEDSRVLAPGDRLVLYTDGVTEAANARGALYGEERLTALVGALPPHLSCEQVTERILEGVRSHLDGEEAGDDITLLVLRVLEPAQPGHAAS
ncbi:MAG TPA: PP2C family protein-serine/threonine phosphatase [Candidatus Eisenbacteria bacterium]|jgi:hypothetical protein